MVIPDPFTHAGRRQWRWLVLSRGWKPFLAVAGAYRRTVARGVLVTAVTGSYGKTTTVRGLRAILGMASDGWAELNTNCLGEIGWTLLREKPWRRHVVVEAGAGTPGKLARYAATLRPDAVVVTCLGSEHLATFGSLEALRAEKSALVRAVKPDGRVILNADDPHVAWMASLTQARTVWFGFGKGVDFRASDVRYDWTWGVQFTLTVAGANHPVRLRWMGIPAVVPALAALAAGVTSGIPVGLAIRRLERVRSTPGRLEKSMAVSGAVLIRDDYKATPETVMTALAVLREHPARQRWVVIGDLNNLPDANEAQAYAAVGAAMATSADRVLVVGDRAGDYGAGFAEVGRSGARLEAVPDVSSAVDRLRGAVGEGDVVLIKGYEDQGLARVALALEGRLVRCGVDWCVIRHQRCGDCPYLGDPDSPGGRIPGWRIPRWSQRSTGAGR